MRQVLKYLKKRPMAVCAVAAAIFTATVFSFERLAIILGISTIILFFVLVWCRAGGRLLFACLMLLAIEIGAISTLNAIHSMEKLEGKEIEGVFVVCESPENRKNYSTAVFESVDCDSLAKGVKIYVRAKDIKLRMGNYVEGRLKIEPTDETFRSYNYSRGVYLYCSLRSVKEMPGEYDRPLAAVSRIQRYISNTLFENLREGEAATLTALVMGDRSYLSDEYYYLLRASGVSHVMVVSGSHLTIIMSFLLFGLERFIYNRHLKALITFCVTVFIIAVCGFNMSMLRAGLTYILVAIALVIGRDIDMINTLGGAVALTLLFQPFAVINVAYQLSVLSTFGILALCGDGSKFICNRLKLKHKFSKGAVASLCCSFSAMVMTIPTCIYYFGYISTVALISNLLISFAVTAALILAIIALCLNLIFIAPAKPFFLAAGLLTKYINLIIEYFGGLPFATAEVPTEFVLAAAAAALLLLQLKGISAFYKRQLSQAK